MYESGIGKNKKQKCRTGIISVVGWTNTMKLNITIITSLLLTLLIIEVSTPLSFKIQLKKQTVHKSIVQANIENFVIYLSRGKWLFLHLWTTYSPQRPLALIIHFQFIAKIHLERGLRWHAAHSSLWRGEVEEEEGALKETHRNVSSSKSLRKRDGEKDLLYSVCSVHGRHHSS